MFDDDKTGFLSRDELVKVFELTRVKVWIAFSGYDI